MRPNERPPDDLSERLETLYVRAAAARLEARRLRACAADPRTTAAAAAVADASPRRAASVNGAAYRAAVELLRG